MLQKYRPAQVYYKIIASGILALICMSLRIGKRRNPREGVTLLEMMTLLAVIALIVGLAAPRIIDSFGRAKGKTATIQISNLKAAPDGFPRPRKWRR
jgi:hypothetical protein